MRYGCVLCFSLVTLAWTNSSVRAFVPLLRPQQGTPCVSLSATEDGDKKGSGGFGFFEGVGNFFQELDNFMDDASARRLGNGAGACVVTYPRRVELLGVSHDVLTHRLTTANCGVTWLPDSNDN